MSAFLSPENRQVDNLIRLQRFVLSVNRILIAIMLSCLVVPVILVLQQIRPDWQGWYLVPVVFLISLESMVSQAYMSKISPVEPRWWIYRFSELIVLVVLLRMLLFGLYSFDRFWLDILSWRQNIWGAFSGPEFLVVLFVLFCTWALAGRMENNLQQLGGDDQLLKAEIDTGYTEERIAIRQQLANTIIALGGLMIALVAFIDIGFGNSLDNAAVVNLGTYAIIVYFCCALMVLSLTQYAILRVRWVIYRVRFDSKITTRWFGFCLFFIISLAIIASLLPTGYSDRLLAWLQVGFAYLIAILQVIIFYLTLPFVLLIGWLLSLFRGNSQPVKTPPIKFQPIPSQISSEPIPWLEAIKTFVFWLVLLGLVAYAFIFYFREHPEYFGWLRRSGLLGRVRQLFTMLTNWFRGVNRQISSSLQNQINRFRGRDDGKTLFTRDRFINPRRLSPRQQVLFYYYALLQRGEAAGVLRSPSQTAGEYSKRLASFLLEEQGVEYQPTHEGESEVNVTQVVKQMTDDFYEARYSLHEINNEEAGLVRRYWERIRGMLRSVRR